MMSRAVAGIFIPRPVKENSTCAYAPGRRPSSPAAAGLSVTFVVATASSLPSSIAAKAFVARLTKAQLTSAGSAWMRLSRGSRLIRWMKLVPHHAPEKLRDLNYQVVQVQRFGRTVVIHPDL